LSRILKLYSSIRSINQIRKNLRAGKIDRSLLQGESFELFSAAINIPSDTELPGVGSLSPEEAQGFTPLPSDPLLCSPPPVDYPIEIPDPRDGTIEEPEPQSTIWPVANPNEPLLFNFLVYQDTQVTLSSMDAAQSTMMSTDKTSANATSTTESVNNGSLTGPFFP